MTDASCCPSVLDSAVAGSQQVDQVRRGVAEIRRIIGVLVTAGQALPLPALAERGPATWSRFASPGAPR